MLSVVRSALFALGCLLFVGCRVCCLLLFVVRRVVLCVVCFLLVAVRCLLCVVCCLLLCVCCSLRGVCCLLFVA